MGVSVQMGVSMQMWNQVENGNEEYVYADYSIVAYGGLVQWVSFF